MGSKLNRKVTACFLLAAPLGDPQARALGYILRLLPREGEDHLGGLHAIGGTFTALVDDELYARIEASPEGVLISMNLPCVFVSEIRTRQEAQQLAGDEAICQGMDLGPNFGRREYLGHALYASYAAAARHHASMDMLVGQDPAGERRDFGGIWKVRVDEAVMARLRERNGGPLFPPSGTDPDARIVPFDHWTARWDPRDDD